jgi:hypothetical protein
MKTALLVIATGEKYHRHIEPLLDSARKYLFPHDVVLWTDSPCHHAVNYQIPKQGLGYPGETLHRYHTFLSQEHVLSQYDFLMYCDVDMLWVAPVKEEDVISTGITATLHPGYLGLTGTPERRPESKAYIPDHANLQYFCGGFNGGTRDTFLWMARHIKTHVDEDTAKGITARWHDESHLNAFLYYNCPPARILSPSFCYPESEYRQPGGYYSAIWQAAGRGKIEPKLLALDKVK